MKINKAMRKFLADATLIVPLESTLKAIGDGGFTVRENCYFLAALFPQAQNVTKASFPDCTGYESFVNSLHIEDYDDTAPLSQAIQFVMHVFFAWRASVPTLTLTSIVSADEFIVVVKFHVKRPGEQLISDNIEDYEDSIMLVDSSEDLDANLARLFR